MNDSGETAALAAPKEQCHTLSGKRTGSGRESEKRPLGRAGGATVWNGFQTGISQVHVQRHSKRDGFAAPLFYFSPGVADAPGGGAGNLGEDGGDFL